MNTDVLLKQHNIRPSIQRIIIYNALAATKRHPSVQSLYNELSPACPTLSKTTVYNTLKLFLEAGLIQELLIDGEEAHYDADISPHIHFKCRGCGRVYDIPGKYPQVDVPEHFSADSMQVFMWGKCAECPS